MMLSFDYDVCFPPWCCLSCSLAIAFFHLFPTASGLRILT
ncbi:hypothetical protein SLEP1_g41303 [Rubroshorea leprosula]|uniref:Uncharacterized protein n=1 Tax=Rubroshorea leprosula TaxID=152421 RepID=A0AAV5L6E9_9ROSI|nr:hypothetical protein SLEP1_g41303 [Rubroshorea leprosula]